MSFVGPTRLLVHPELRERAERILRQDAADRALEKARRTVACIADGVTEVYGLGLDGCGLVEINRNEEDTSPFDIVQDSRSQAHWQVASFLLYGFSVEEITRAGR